MKLLQFIVIFSAGLLIPAIGIEILNRGDFKLQLIGTTKHLKEGKVTLKYGSDVAIYCFSIRTHPKWKIPPDSHAFEGPIVKRENEVVLLGSFLILNGTSSEDAGTYECFGERHRTFRMILEVTEAEVLEPELSKIDETIYDFNTTQESSSSYLETVTISDISTTKTLENSEFWKGISEVPVFSENYNLEDESWQLSITEEYSDIKTGENTPEYDEAMENEILSDDEASNVIASRTISNQKPKEKASTMNEEITLLSLESTTSIPILNKETEDGEDFKVLMVELPKFQEGDVLVMEAGETRTIACYHALGYPRWITPDGSRTRKHDVPLNIEGQLLYTTYVNITKARPGDSGKYECVGKHSSTIITVKIKGVTCPELKVLDHVEMSLSNGVKEGSWASFRCLPSRKMFGTARIQCQSNGKWSDSVPVCRFRYACDDLPPLVGGLLTYWTRNVPSKKSSVIDLPDLKLFKNVKEPNLLFSSNLHKIGTIAVHKCSSINYEIIGSKFRKCLKGGRWSGSPASCSPICGQRNSTEFEKIASGSVEDSAQWPWQVAIFRLFPTNISILYCGGSLLNERWIITAAHCLTEKLLVDTVVEPYYFQVHVGKYYRKNTEEDLFMQTAKVRAIHVHPDYDPQFLDADIALMELDSPVNLDGQVQPICLPTKETAEKNLVDGRKGIFTGWGINGTGDHPEVLQQIKIPVSKNEICGRSFTDAGLTIPLTDNMFCAGDGGYSEVCRGYSGGPMVFEVDYPNEKRWVLEGIVSFGSPQGCRIANQYSGFTKVVNFLDWIREIV